jgi:hypothetical protein
MRKISFILILFFAISFNSNLVKYAWGGWGGPVIKANAFCDTMLDRDTHEIIKKLYSGNCLFLDSANKVAKVWDDFSHVIIWIDGAHWYRIVTNEDNTIKRMLMDYFNKVVEAAIEYANAPPGTEARFILVNRNGNVMARGIYINGKMIPNFVEPIFWNSR